MKRAILAVVCFMSIVIVLGNYTAYAASKLSRKDAEKSIKRSEQYRQVVIFYVPQSYRAGTTCLEQTIHWPGDMVSKESFIDFINKGYFTVMYNSDRPCGQFTGKIGELLKNNQAQGNVGWKNLLVAEISKVIIGGIQQQSDNYVVVECEIIYKKNKIGNILIPTNELRKEARISFKRYDDGWRITE